MRTLLSTIKHSTRSRELLKYILLFSMVVNCYVILLLNGRMYDNEPVAIRERASILQWPKHTLCIYFEGGLGNNLFQYASTYGISKKKGFGVVISRRSQILNLFNINTLTYNHACECSRRKVVVEEKPCRYDPKVYNFSTNRDYRIRNFLQSWKYFEDDLDNIRSQYVIKQHIQDRADELIRKFVARHFDRPPSDLVFVGIHIRRGDILKKVKIEYGYRTAPKQYIYKSIQRFRQIYNHVIFFVCSNDLRWSRRILHGWNNMIFVSGNHRAVDFAILSSMNHSIITVGTFSWWSGFIANGTVIYLKNFLTPNSQLRYEFSADFKDYFLPQWIPM